MIVRGKCWKLGDNITTDHIISGKYKFSAIHDLTAMLPHVLEEVIPDFYRKVRKGDIIVAGRNFGKGSSREHAAILLKMAGVGAVVAKSFSHIFFRNAINIGLPVIIAKIIPDVTQQGDLIEIDLRNGIVRNVDKGVEEPFRPYPKQLQLMLVHGGLVEYIKKFGAPPW